MVKNKIYLDEIFDLNVYKFKKWISCEKINCLNFLFKFLLEYFGSFIVKWIYLRDLKKEIENFGCFEICGWLISY